MERVRVGLIGCGGNMRAHIQRIEGFPDAEIVACADPVEANFQRARPLFAEGREVRFYRDHRAMLDAGGLDAVLVSTPHTLHFEQVRDALTAGLHVMVEKPMVSSSDEARELIALRDRVGRQLLVGYQRHYEPAYRYVRERFASGAWQAPHYAAVWQSQNWLVETAGTWRQDPALSGGGQLNDSGSHLVDILLWMSGLKAAEVFAYSDNRGAAVDILTSATIRFTNGALGTLAVVGDSRASGMQEGIYLWHEGGMVEIPSLGGGRLILRDPDRRELEEGELPPRSTPDRNFIDAVLGKAEVESTAESALEVIRLTEALWESSRTGLPVRLSAAAERRASGEGL